MAAPSGSKKGWADSKTGGALHLDFSLTVWNNETTPRFSLPILDPNEKDAWLPDNWSHLQVHFLFERIRLHQRVYFAKYRTVTTMLLKDLYNKKERLDLVSLEFWQGKSVSYALRFENALIDTVYGRIAPSIFGDDPAPAGIGLHNRFSMVAQNVRFYDFRGHNMLHVWIQQWRDS
jgi:hypothetical protein